MRNSLLLSINIGLLISYIFTYFCHGQIDIYKNELTDELLTRYKAINKERMLHFFIGIVIAFVISFIYYFRVSKEVSMFEKVNIILFTLLFIPMVVYKLLPKTDYMLKHSQPDQVYKDWFNIYLCMKNKTMYGFLAGFFISIIILTTMNIN